MTEFKRITDQLLAAGQLEPADIARAKEQGVGLIINNRPDDEAPGQPRGAEIERAAREAGIAYRAIPVGPSGFGPPQVEAMSEALDQAEGRVLAFCRTGTRSTLLWALTEARRGSDPEDIARTAAVAGYDVAPVRPALDLLADQARG